MDKKALIAALSVLPVVSAETVDAGEHPFTGLPVNSFDSAASNTPVNPHLHFDSEDGTLPTLEDPVAASGRSNFRDVFRLRILTDPNGYRLVGYPCDTDVNKFPQRMYGSFPDIDSLAASFRSISAYRLRSLRRFAVPPLKANSKKSAVMAGARSSVFSDVAIWKKLA